MKYNCSLFCQSSYLTSTLRNLLSFRIWVGLTQPLQNRLCMVTTTYKNTFSDLISSQTCSATKALVVVTFVSLLRNVSYFSLFISKERSSFFLYQYQITSIQKLIMINEMLLASGHALTIYWKKTLTQMWTILEA